MKLVQMKKSLLLFLLGVCSLLNVFSQEITWPRELNNSGSILTVYQPQVESWENQEEINFRMAFSLVPSGEKEFIGVVYMSALTSVDMDTHMVSIHNMEVMKTDFPALSADSVQTMEAVVKTFITSSNQMNMPLEQVVASAPKTAPKKKIQVNNTPPEIFYSYKPAILLQLEGEPVKTPVTEDIKDLEYVINSNFSLFFDTSTAEYYLFDGLEWQKSKNVSGDWSFTDSLPTELVSLPSNSNWSHLKAAFPVATEPSKEMPTVFFAEKTAEIILFEGDPVYTTIDGTSLRFATNTTSDVFFSESNSTYYYLSSGRWFSATSLKGPWDFATYNLPADFLKIPSTSPASAVLAYVPGTDEASDAVMIAQIPTKIQVNAVEAAQQVSITYSGTPEFKSIDSTSLKYAVNTTDKVIEVSSDEYYACVQGVWFSSAAATGPWEAAVSVPEVIYDMPPSSPVYNVTYVTQSINSENEVESTYTSGYTGTYITGTGTNTIVISGTGYYYPPYYYYPPMGFPICFMYPMTYGCWAYHAYHPYGYGNVAYHTAYNPATGAYGRGLTGYGPYGSASVGQGYNPSTGTFARGASETNGAYSRAGAQAYNPYTGGSATSRQYSNPNGQWGSSKVTTGTGRTAYTGHVQSDSGAEVAGKAGMNGTAAVGKTASGDMYASKDGNVYKKTDDGWESHGNTGWSSTAGRNDMNTQSLNNEFQNRQRGGVQAQQFSGRAGGLGGFSGGGGFGGGGFRGRR